MSYLALIFATIFVNNIVLNRFLGLCPFFGVSGHFKQTFGMGLVTTFVLGIAALVGYWVNQAILVPYDLIYMRSLVIILVIATSVQLLDIILKSLLPVFYSMVGLFLPLVTSNCAILGLGLSATLEVDSAFQALIYGYSAGIGFTLVLLLMSATRIYLETTDVSLLWRGSPILLFTAGMISFAFIGFSGLFL